MFQLSKELQRKVQIVKVLDGNNNIITGDVIDEDDGCFQRTKPTNPFLFGRAVEVGSRQSLLSTLNQQTISNIDKVMRHEWKAE